MVGVYKRIYAEALGKDAIDWMRVFCGLPEVIYRRC